MSRLTASSGIGLASRRIRPRNRATMRPMLDQVTASSSNHHAVFIRDVSLESPARMGKLNNQCNGGRFLLLWEAAVRRRTGKVGLSRKSATCGGISTVKSGGAVR